MSSSLSNRYAPTYWGSLKHFQVPTSIVQATDLPQKRWSIIFHNPALSVLLVLFRFAQQKNKTLESGMPVVLKMKASTISERTGFSKDKITEGTKELEILSYLR